MEILRFILLSAQISPETFTLPLFRFKALIFLILVFYFRLLSLTSQVMGYDYDLKRLSHYCFRRYQY